MAGRFPPQFGEEWESERSIFYRGLFGDLDDSDDDDVIRYAILKATVGQSDPTLLIEAIEALVRRIHIASEVLQDWQVDQFGNDRNGVSEVLSDSGLMLLHIKDMLSEFGHGGAPAIKIEHRHAGKPVDFATLREGLRLGAAAQALIDQGKRKKVADGIVANATGKPADYVRKWRCRRTALVEEMNVVQREGTYSGN